MDGIPGDSDQFTLLSANPADVHYLHFLVTNTNGSATANTVVMNIKIEYYCLLSGLVKDKAAD